MKLEIQALCQKGIVRDNNEDMVSVGGILLRDNEMAFPVELNDNSQFYLLVADGMGGHEHGEVIDALADGTFEPKPKAKVDRWDVR